MTAHAVVGNGVRWAVLSAFARSLSPGKNRTAVRLYATNLRPIIGKQGEALVSATDLGLTRAGELTLEGLAAAGNYLAEILEGAEVPDLSCVLRSKVTEDRESYHPYLRFLSEVLARDIPNPCLREDLTRMHEQLQALVDGAPYTDLNVLSLVQTVGYLQSGINLATGEYVQ